MIDMTLNNQPVISMREVERPGHLEREVKSEEWTLRLLCTAQDAVMEIKGPGQKLRIDWLGHVECTSCRTYHIEPLWSPRWRGSLPLDIYRCVLAWEDVYLCSYDPECPERTFQHYASK